MGVRRGAYRVLVGKPEGKGPCDSNGKGGGGIILKSDFKR
jgi:hypothetical protein